MSATTANPAITHENTMSATVMLVKPTWRRSNQNGFSSNHFGIGHAGRSILTTAPVATADATDTRPRHLGFAADPCWHHVLESAWVRRLRTIFRCRV
jgi:hypothetical protein